MLLKFFPIFRLNSCAINHQIFSMKNTLSSIKIVEMLISAGFWSFLQNPVESRGIKFGRDTSQNDILGDKNSSRMMSFLISHWNGQKGMEPESKTLMSECVLPTLKSSLAICRGLIWHHQTTHNGCLLTTTIVNNDPVHHITTITNGYHQLPLSLSPPTTITGHLQ